MFYQLYELNHASLQPLRAYADTMRLFYTNPLNPFSHTRMGALRRRHGGTRSSARRDVTASLLSTCRRPTVDWNTVEVTEKVVWSRPFCNLINFERAAAGGPPPGPEAAHRRADVRPLRDAAARHGRGDAAARRRLHHRLGRRAHGAGVGRQVRSRRLYRLRHRHAARARARTPM